MKSFLTREGYSVTVADSGPAGLLRARELKPDVITLDIAMPGMDGWSVLSALKNDPDLRDIPVVILTMADNKNLGYALGATEYLMKPIDRERMAAVLRKYSRLSSQSDSGSGRRSEYARPASVHPDQRRMERSDGREWPGRLGEGERRSPGSGASGSDDAGNGWLRFSGGVSKASVGWRASQ